MKNIFFRTNCLLYACVYLFFSSCYKESKCDCEADTITIAKVFQPDGITGKDAVIETLTPDKNFGSVPYNTLFSWTTNGEFNTARTLLEFDLSIIPAQTKIKKATLFLYWTSYDNLKEHTGENAFTIYRISEEWDENSVSWNQQPLYSLSHKVAVPKSSTINQSYLNIDVTEIVQDMIDVPASSHGFMFVLNEEYPYRLVVLGSSDSPESNKRPKLIIYL